MTSPSPWDAATWYNELGFTCVPVNITVDQNGDKVVDTPSWRGRRFDCEADWDGFSGVAINTGASGLVVVDVDTNDGKDGFAGLTASGVELPETPVKAFSRSGGQHWFYRAGSTPVGTSAGLLARDVDIRAEGGLIFVAPTQMVGAPEQRYEWQPGCSPQPPGVAALPEFPEELARRLVIAKRRIPVAVEPALTELTPAQREWALRKINLKLGDITQAPDGQRNQTLGQAVPRIVGLVKTLGEPLEPYAEKILAAYTESGGDDEAQCLGWISSAAEYVSAEDPAHWLRADRQRSFWDSRPELRQIRQAAQAGMAAPYAVLGALCVQVLADVPPSHRLITGIGDPAGGNLNLYAVLAAESGGGKGIATQVARHLWPSDVYSVEIASGEALPKLFARRVKDAETGEWSTERIRDSVIVDAPEFGSLSASGARTGATLVQRLCNGFSGEGLSFAVSDESRNVDVPANSYRLGVITGVQYGNAGLMLSESSSITGVPQRFVWFPANVTADEVPDVRPDMPGPLRQHMFSPWSTRIEICAEAKHDIEAAQRAKLIGDRSSPLDGHKLYARIKLAYALAVLNGHVSSVRSEDWYLSGIVMDVSEQTRNKALETLRKLDRSRAEAAGVRDGVRKAAAAEAAAEESVARTADSIERGLRKPKYATGANFSTIRRSLSSSAREHAEDAIDRLLAEARIVKRDEDWYVVA